jgi:hypothetical protein
MTSPGLPGAGTGLGVQAAPFLESTESGVISGSAGLDYRKTACGPYFPVCATPFKAADPREWLPHLCDKTARKKAQRRQSSEAGASPSCAAAVNISARSKRPIAEAVAIKQFALDDDQRRRLLIRERSLLHEALDPRHAARFSE